MFTFESIHNKEHTAFNENWKIIKLNIHAKKLTAAVKKHYFESAFPNTFVCLLDKILSPESSSERCSFETTRQWKYYVDIYIFSSERLCKIKWTWTTLSVANLSGQYRSENWKRYKHSRRTDYSSSKASSFLTWISSNL